MAETIVFAGPSLPARPDDEWRALLARVELRPPARRGDVLAALPGEPRAIVLLDGYYYTVPSVAHKELLYALDAGVRVVGAASLGALRAVEMAPFGMDGVGRVFEWYRDGAITGDDEVAILHGSAAEGYRGLTLALVELRHALALAGTGADAAQALIARVQALAFSDREPARVLAMARDELGAAGASILAETLRASSVKTADAKRALRHALEERARTRSRVARAPETGYLSSYKEDAIPCPGPTGVSLGDAYRLTQLLHPAAARFADEARRRALLAAAAVRAGIAPDPADVGELESALRRTHVDRHGTLVLPSPEYREEARALVLAGLACARLGGAKRAFASWRDDVGRGTSGVPTPERLLALQPDLVPAFTLVRAFSFTPALATAGLAAAAAREVRACHRRASGGAPIVRADLVRLASELWSCAPSEVEPEGARRGLFRAAGLSNGLDEALELAAAAERLPQAINDYPAARARLLRTSLGHVLRDASHSDAIHEEGAKT